MFYCFKLESISFPTNLFRIGSSGYIGKLYWSMNHNLLSLLVDWRGLKHLRIKAAKSPKINDIIIVINNEANCSPPCRWALTLKVGILSFRPAAKIESKMPPNTHKMIASIEYSFKRIKGKNFSKRNSKIGANIPIKSEAKGSIITVDEELKNMPVYIYHNLYHN